MSSGLFASDILRVLWRVPPYSSPQNAPQQHLLLLFCLQLISKSLGPLSATILEFSWINLLFLKPSDASPVGDICSTILNYWKCHCINCSSQVYGDILFRPSFCAPDMRALLLRCRCVCICYWCYYPPMLFWVIWCDISLWKRHTIAS